METSEDEPSEVGRSCWQLKQRKKLWGAVVDRPEALGGSVCKGRRSGRGAGGASKSKWAPNQVGSRGQTNPSDLSRPPWTMPVEP